MQHGSSLGLSYFLIRVKKEYMMKKSGLILGVLVGVATLSTACTSNQSTQSPETAQQTAQQTATMSDQQSAQTATVDSSQQGIAVESDANMQQSQPTQVTNDPNTIEQPSAQ